MKNKFFTVYFMIIFLLLTGLNALAEEFVISENNITNSQPTCYNTEKNHWLNYIFKTNQPEIQSQNVNDDYYSYQQDNVAIDYPAVDELEKKILGKIYPEQDIYIRLNRLETSVFGGVTTASLSERVEKLRDVVPEKNTFTASRLGFTSGNFSGSQSFSGGNLSSSNSSTSFTPNYAKYNNPGSNYAAALYELEKEFLGQTYSSEHVESRLIRLENEVFSSTSEDSPMEDRINRLSAYADARDSNDFYENQTSLRNYNNMASGAKALSILFMILQFLL